MKYFLLYLNETEKIDTSLRPEDVNNTLYSEILSKIENSYIHSISTKPNSIEFKAPIFRFVWNGFNLFNPVSKASITFSTIEKKPYISYQFFFFEFFIYAIIFSTIPLFSCFIAPVYKALTIIGIWIIYFISTVLAAHRFENFAKKLIQKIENQSQK